MTFDEIAFEQRQKEQFKSQFKDFHQFEKKVINNYVDTYGNKLVKKLGFRRAVWLNLTQFLLAVVIVLNMFACYARPDFSTTLVCALAIFYLNENEDVSRDKFRFVPFLQFLSIIYDFFWLFFLQELEKEGATQEGGLE